VFFEGSEKKLEIIIDEDAVNLLEIKDSFWTDVVKSCRAEIISTISNKYLKAFLLSESSLFVWKDRIVMITCGQTILANSVEYLISELGRDVVDSLIFQRKNEYDSRLQKSSFLDDVARFQHHFPGKAFRLGYLDGHHNYIYHSNGALESSKDDNTAELLMYHITGDVRDILLTPNQSKEVIRDLIKPESLFKGFQIDDFIFEPFGYSLNAINARDYATIHISPQEGTSYISFETNMNSEKTRELLPKIIDIFSPRSFDYIGFNHDEGIRFNDNFNNISTFRDIISGYDVNFEHHICTTDGPRKAIPLI
jgi:S-adenosylmethionine decarboxylase